MENQLPNLIVIAKIILIMTMNSEEIKDVDDKVVELIIINIKIMSCSYLMRGYRQSLKLKLKN